MVTKSVVSFGEMPIANYFVKEIDKNLYRFTLSVSFCPNCYLLQLDHQPDPDVMFNSTYPFFTGLSEVMKRHFSQMVEDALAKLDIPESQIKVLEIGCNDGTLLENVLKKGINHLGIDPSSNVVQRARGKGVNARVEFFSSETAEDVERTMGKFDLIMAANVVCHIPNIRDFAKGISHLLNYGGTFVFEEPYAGDVLAKVSYDQFYDEHVFMFSSLSVSKVFSEYGLELIDVSHQSTHGGSMRYTLARTGERNVSISVEEQLRWETDTGLDTLDAYIKFGENCALRKSEFVSLLRHLKSLGHTIAGYAATSKSTTVLNYCQIDSTLISCIADLTPEKQGSFCPGSNIPVVTPGELERIKPDFIVLFAWNHESEILRKEKWVSESGSKWIRFVPRVEIF